MDLQMQGTDSMWKSQGCREPDFDGHVGDLALPTVTVIMPVRNEAAYIGKALTSVLNQDYLPEQVEIIVVDGMSSDETRATIRMVLNEYPDRDVQLLDNPARYVSHGLNVGLRQAHGEIIVRVDGHCELPVDYLSKCVGVLRETGAACAGGTINTVGETRLSQLIALVQSSPYGVGGSTFRTGATGRRHVDTLAFGAYRREVFDVIGRFDEEMVRTQDAEFNYRLIESGFHIMLDPEISTTYYARADFRSLWKQYYGYGFWKARLLQKRPRQMQVRHFVPLLFVTSLVSSFSLVMLWAPALAIFLSLLGSYAAFNLIASLSIAAKCRERRIWVFSLGLATLHISYGLGFLIGLLKFAPKWLSLLGRTRSSQR